MTQIEVRESIDNLNKSVGECEEEAIILSSTATNRNTVSLFRREINDETFRQNGIEIARLAEEFITRCKCRLR